MYRVTKANGWNKYKIQKKGWFFWHDVERPLFNNKGLALIEWANLTLKDKEG
jgi:hypothetical protein